MIDLEQKHLDPAGAMPEVATFGNWSEVSVPWPKNINLQCLDFNDDYNEFYALHPSTGLYRSTNGISWTALRLGLPDGLTYYDYEVVTAHYPKYELLILIATSGGVYRANMKSTNPVFVHSSNGLPTARVQSIAWNGVFADGGVLLCGIYSSTPRNTLYFSSDYGNSWSALDSNFCGFPINSVPQEIITRCYRGNFIRTFDNTVYVCGDNNLLGWSKIPSLKDINSHGKAGVYFFWGNNAGKFYIMDLDHGYHLTELPAPAIPLAMSKRASSGTPLIVNFNGKGLLTLWNYNQPLNWDDSLNVSFPQNGPKSFINLYKIAIDKGLNNICVASGQPYSTERKVFHCSQAAAILTE